VGLAGVGVGTRLRVTDDDRKPTLARSSASELAGDEIRNGSGDRLRVLDCVDLDAEEEDVIAGLLVVEPAE